MSPATIKSETVGTAALELLKNADGKQSVIETQRAMQKGYIDSLIECALSGAKVHGKEKPFYVCVQTRRERLLSNVIRNQFYSRQTRPSPAYDLALFHYDPRDEKLQFVWCVPDRETVDELTDPGYIPENDMRQLWEFCKWFKAGTLI